MNSDEEFFWWQGRLLQLEGMPMILHCSKCIDINPTFFSKCCYNCRGVGVEAIPLSEIL